MEGSPGSKIELKQDDKCALCGDSLLKDGKQFCELVTDKVTIITENGSQKQVPTRLFHKPCFSSMAGSHRIAFLVNCWSIGDNIAATPALREVRRVYPDAIIDVVTMFPEIWINNPNKNGVVQFFYQQEFKLDGYDMIINSFDVFSQGIPHHWCTHGALFSLICSLRKTLPYNLLGYEVNYEEGNIKNVINIAKELNIDLDNKFTIIHPYDSEWVTRCWGKDNWQNIIDHVAKDHTVIAIGGKRDGKEMNNYHEFKNCISLYNKLSVLDTLALMDNPNCELVITFDTAPLHIAGCTKETKILGLFSLVNSYFRTPIRNNKFGYKFYAIDSKSKCSCTFDNSLLYEMVDLNSCNRKKIIKELNKHDLEIDYKKNIWKKYFDGEFSNQSLMKIEEDYKDIPCMPRLEDVIKKINSIYEEI